ncbi:MAG: hypothetical protein ABI076_01480, partial [Acidobacteriaceae bacterium]
MKEPPAVQTRKWLVHKISMFDIVIVTGSRGGTHSPNGLFGRVFAPRIRNGRRILPRDLQNALLDGH